MRVAQAVASVVAVVCLVTGCSPKPGPIATTEDPNVAVCKEFAMTDGELVTVLRDWTSALPADSSWQDQISPQAFSTAQETSEKWDELYLRAGGDVKDRLEVFVDTFPDEQNVFWIANVDSPLSETFFEGRDRMVRACAVDAVEISVQSWTPPHLPAY